MTDRNAELVRLHSSGTKMVDLARRFDISPSRVGEIIKRARYVSERRPVRGQPVTTSSPISAVWCEDVALEQRTRMENALLGLLGVEATVGDVVKLRKHQLLRAKGIARKGLLALVRSLATHGYGLADSSTCPHCGHYIR